MHFYRAVLFILHITGLSLVCFVSVSPASPRAIDGQATGGLQVIYWVHSILGGFFFFLFSGASCPGLPQATHDDATKRHVCHFFLLRLPVEGGAAKDARLSKGSRRRRRKHAMSRRRFGRRCTRNYQAAVSCVRWTLGPKPLRRRWRRPICERSTPVSQS